MYVRIRDLCTMLSALPRADAPDRAAEIHERLQLGFTVTDRGTSARIRAWTAPRCPGIGPIKPV